MLRGEGKLPTVNIVAAIEIVGVPIGHQVVQRISGQVFEVFPGLTKIV